MTVRTWMQAFLVVAVCATALGCNQTGHFVPGESPTVTPSYNAEGTPSAPIAITNDLPPGWRWQYSREFPVRGKDSWALLGAESEIVGFIVHEGGDCWVLIGQGVPDLSCQSRNEIGRLAVEVLAAGNTAAVPTASPTPIPTTLEGRYKARGQELHEDRTPDLRWADGSHWEDGVSHELPRLPLDAEAFISESMTCIQAEALESVTFPHELADKNTWHLQPTADAIASEWERRHAEALWGPDPRAATWLGREQFTDWCGERMQAAP